ncbi:MAG: hypothetical protein K2Y23_25995 [Cyanobacteria bacterium]|nr:hypothetical protein [Cyanobacteriota bacterium]
MRRHVGKHRHAAGVVNAVVGGSKLHIKVQETIYHPGFYRVALAVKSFDELPPDPVAVTRETPLRRRQNHR